MTLGPEFTFKDCVRFFLWSAVLFHVSFIALMGLIGHMVYEAPIQSILAFAVSKGAWMQGAITFGIALSGIAASKIAISFLRRHATKA